MKYLISGHPRTRSAWLCALLNAHGSRCFHDAKIQNIPLSVNAGISDPSFACFWPWLNQGDAPQICIRRADWVQAMETWSDIKIEQMLEDRANWNVGLFARDSFCASFEELDDNDVIAEIVQICIGRPASQELIQIFQGLRIEQAKEKFPFDSVSLPWALTT